MTAGHFLFLGTGGSMGIPVIACHCAVCQSESPCNCRMRPSALITVNGKRFLIDCGPDFRSQALHYHIDTLDGIILTHAHHDHTAGIDELRVFYLHQKKVLPCLLSEATASELRRRYHYIFDDRLAKQKFTARIDLQILEGERGQTSFQGMQIKYVTYTQGGMKVNGFRFGNLAYISDIKEYDDSIFEDLKGIETLIISALRPTPSPMHLNVDDAIAFANRTQAKHTWLTHIAHELDHEEANAYLPTNVRMAYDGLELNFTPDLF